MNRYAQLHIVIVLFFGVIIQGFSWEQMGIASWYGGIFQGRLTANGEVYDTYGYTAAHNTLPFGTLVTVKNLANQKEVTVRVNDRGPFVDNRIIDLTYAAAKALNMIRNGTAKVHLTVKDENMTKEYFNVQIGAWKLMENAQLHRNRLEKSGLNPTASLNSQGITRLSIKNVSKPNLQELLDKLKELGYVKPLVSRFYR